MPESDLIGDFVDKFIWPDKSVIGSMHNTDNADKSVNGSRSNPY